MGGLIADLVAANRMVLEDIRTRQVIQGLEQSRAKAAAGQPPVQGDVSEPGARRRAKESIKLV